MNIRPLHDRVIVRRIDSAENMVGSIIIPDSAKEKPQQGEVVAVGAGALLETGERAAVEVQPGNRILFGKYAGSEVKLLGTEYLILREDEILAVLD
jgi:chaperonin GroES